MPGREDVFSSSALLFNFLHTLKQSKLRQLLVWTVYLSNKMSLGTLCYNHLFEFILI